MIEMKKNVIIIVAIGCSLFFVWLVSVSGGCVDGMGPVRVIGSVVDAETGKPIVNAAIAFKPAEEEPAWGRAAPEGEGSFEVSVQGWIYYGTDHLSLWREAWYYPFIMEVKAPGYETASREFDSVPVTRSNPDRLRVGIIELVPLREGEAKDEQLGSNVSVPGS